jgi:hypothetical protein
MLGVDEDSEPDMNVEAMVKYQDVFLEREKQINKSLDQITSEPLNDNQAEIVRYLNIALSGTGESDDEFEDAMVTYVQLIMLRDEQAADRLEEHGAKEKFITFVLDSIIEYGEDLQRLNFQRVQGKKWWSFVDMDRVVKDTGIRHHHKITLDTKDTKEIHSTPQSDWMLVRHLLDSIYGSYGMYGELDQMIDLDVFDQVRAYVYGFEDELQEAGVELASKEELIESPESIEREDG